MPAAAASRRTLVWALVVAFLLEHVIPFGGLVMYPFTLLTTWVHETGHGVSALVVGGHFDKLEIFWDASGRALTREATGWPLAIVCLGGLLAPPFVGTALLLISRGARRARVALFVLSGALLV